MIKASWPYQMSSRFGLDKCVVAIGEILWDLMPSEAVLGGAPTNVAIHLHALGGSVRLISRIGADDWGRLALQVLRQRGLATDSIQVDPFAPTGTVGVTFSDDGQPRYSIRENVAWDYLEADESTQAVVRAADAVVFGTLAQRSRQSRQAIQQLLAATSHDCLKVLDLNLRPPNVCDEIIHESLTRADILKLNTEELHFVCGCLSLTQSSLRSQLADLTQRYQLQAVCLTRGERGSVLFTDGHFYEHPGYTVRVVDTVGAGDAFTAVLAFGWLQGWSPECIIERANRRAAEVCTHRGAIPGIA